MIAVRALHLLMIALLAGCNTTWRPCADGGDVSWDPPIKGNRRCKQVRISDNKWVNQGEFLQYHPKGQVAVKGEFHNGKRNGTWVYSDENGKVLKRLYYNELGELVADPRGAKAHVMNADEERELKKQTEEEMKKRAAMTHQAAPARGNEKPAKESLEDALESQHKKKISPQI